MRQSFRQSACSKKRISRSLDQPGDIQSQSGLKAIMEAQYRSINRGGESIFDMVRKAGFHPCVSLV
jgi:hypothetical protein